jgi:uncharacterized protein HemY
MPKTSPAKEPDVLQSERFKQAARESKPPKMTPAQQKRAFIEAAREAGCSEDEAEFNATLAKIAKPSGASS